MEEKAAAGDGNAGGYFKHLRDLVGGGFVAREMGGKDPPYRGNTMVAEWEGCPGNVREKIRENEQRAKG